MTLLLTRPYVLNVPYFIPVKRIDTNCIEIKITDSLNLPIEFLGDEPLVMILEFRKVGYKGL